VALIAAGLKLAAHDPAELLTTLARQRKKTVIVVDALDEADDKDQIVAQLLRPFAKLPQIFLLVGTRPDSTGSGKRFRALGEKVVEIDLDHRRYVGVDDVARYVERRLLAAEEPARPTPYRDFPETVQTVARAVAARARNVFLVAHTTVHALLSAKSIIDLTRQGWVQRLPTGLDSAFAQFLAETHARRTAYRRRRLAPCFCHSALPRVKGCPGLTCGLLQHPLFPARPSPTPTSRSFESARRLLLSRRLNRTDRSIVFIMSALPS
jgi:hypothetical protein